MNWRDGDGFYVWRGVQWIRVCPRGGGVANLLRAGYGSEVSATGRGL
jgi:hypothetical protein